MINAILNNNPLPIQGDGEQLRSFCYVEDLTQALINALDCKHAGPINIGSNHEISMLELANVLKKITKYTATNTYLEKRVEDPSNRCPDLSNARLYLGWSPTTILEDGLSKTCSYYGINI
jgi:nucleoside-diphosphate-sugar epimerase